MIPGWLTLVAERPAVIWGLDSPSVRPMFWFEFDLSFIRLWIPDL